MTDKVKGHTVRGHS